MGTAASELYDLTPTTSVVVKIKTASEMKKIITNAAKLFYFCQDRETFIVFHQSQMYFIVIICINQLHTSVEFLRKVKVIFLRILFYTLLWL